MGERTYIAIDLKSFYASVECVELGLDPLDANLVVADSSRTEKTICLAVSPALKAIGIPGRARLFEVVQQVKTENARRLGRVKSGGFSGKSSSARELKNDPSLELDYIVAKPRMAKYMEYSTRIYNIYTRFVAPEDIHVYSIDEVFMDATDYLRTRDMSAHDFARLMIHEVLAQTGITATAGIGSNLYLCKVAMDVMAKRAKADRDGVRIGELNEKSYRQILWDHEPLTDFWRVGRGYAKKLEAVGLRTMGDIARCSLGGAGDYYNEELLYKLFGVNAQLLIDHAWGWEPCTIKAIKSYRPETYSISSGQVLQHPYDFQHAKMIVREMADALVLDLVDKGLVTDQIILTVGYEMDRGGSGFTGELKTDMYGRNIPKAAHGSVNLGCFSSSNRLITEKTMELFDRIVDEKLQVRRMYVVAANVNPKGCTKDKGFRQLDLFTDIEAEEKRRETDIAAQEREEKRQQAMLKIKKKYGKNAILHGTSYQEGATGRDRNRQIGGHRA